MKIHPDEGVYVISVVSKIIGVPPKTLRQYDRTGILSPKRTPTNQRLYSQKDVEKLNFLAYLAKVKRVNIAGLREIVRILEHVPKEIRGEMMPEIHKEMMRETENEINLG